MQFGFIGDFQRFLKLLGSESSMPPEMERAILRLQYIQRWFQHHQGRAMVRKECRVCERLRLFTIWSDGNYHCLYCLYTQAWKEQQGPIELEATSAVTREFTQMWLSYRRCCQALDQAVEDGWALAEEHAFARFSLPPAPLCVAEDCPVCRTCRPHVLGAGKIKRCFYCLMKQGLQAVPATQPKRPTRERLNDAAAIALAALRTAV